MKQLLAFSISGGIYALQILYFGLTLFTPEDTSTVNLPGNQFLDTYSSPGLLERTNAYT